MELAGTAVLFGNRQIAITDAHVHTAGDFGHIGDFDECGSPRNFDPSGLIYYQYPKNDDADGDDHPAERIVPILAAVVNPDLDLKVLILAEPLPNTVPFTNSAWPPYTDGATETAIVGFGGPGPDSESPVCASPPPPPVPEANALLGKVWHPPECCAKLYPSDGTTFIVRAENQGITDPGDSGSAAYAIQRGLEDDPITIRYDECYGIFSETKRDGINTDLIFTAFTSDVTSWARCVAQSYGITI
jgi:hypothetical protein